MVLSHVYYDGVSLSCRSLNDSPGAQYHINGHVLHVSWQGKSCRVRLQIGEVYTVIINHSNLPEIKHNLPPNQPASALAWLLGFASSARTWQRDTFDRRLHRLRTSSHGRTHPEHHLCGPGYDFVYRVSPGRATPIASYIDDATRIDLKFIDGVLDTIAHSPIASLVSPLPYPRAYFQKVLCQSAHLPESDLQTVLAAYPSLFA